MAWSEQLKPYAQEVETRGSVKEGDGEGGQIAAEELLKPGEAPNQAPHGRAATPAQPDLRSVLPVMRLEQLEAVAEDVEAGGSVKESAGEGERIAAEELFKPGEASNRTPHAWAARLAQAERLREVEAKPAKSRAVDRPNELRTNREQTRFEPATRKFHQPASSARPATPLVKDKDEPLSQQARRFLKPLVGIEPASVPLLKGPQAERMTGANRADAMTDGEMIALGESHKGEAPETLGVIAHELTHIARRRQPRFVPPITRDSRRKVSINPAPANMDEEALARLVESRVIARAKSPQPADAEFADQHAHDAPKKTAKDWGGVPAPWEALPEWMTPATVVATEAAISQTRASINSDPVTYSSSAVSSSPSGNSPGSLRLAEQDRPLPDYAAGSGDSKTGDGSQVSPDLSSDLDVMAQKVYAILKRRLAVERRREMF